MSETQSSQTVEVKILERSYVVGCPDDKQSDLVNSAKYLDRKMREIRDTGKVIGTERIAIMAALNIAYEMLHDNQGSKDSQEQIQRINEKLSAAIQALRQDDKDTDAA
ncbi:MAG: cell division protein ZapA [Oceanospirillum sp.]|nr:cell division protein ZapA [Oceanospirillum sp.]MDX1398124.1 cell division protein ZapA [Oceanospirillum sp.]